MGQPVLGCFHFGVYTVTRAVHLDMEHEFPTDFRKRGS